MPGHVRPLPRGTSKEANNFILKMFVYTEYLFCDILVIHFIAVGIVTKTNLKFGKNVDILI